MTRKEKWDLIKQGISAAVGFCAGSVLEKALKNVVSTSSVPAKIVVSVGCMALSGFVGGLVDKDVHETLNQLDPIVNMEFSIVDSVEVG